MQLLFHLDLWVSNGVSYPDQYPELSRTILRILKCPESKTWVLSMLHTHHWVKKKTKFHTY